MAIAVGSTSSIGGGGVTSLTVSHTVASGTDRVLVVRLVAALWNNVAISWASVTFGGVGLTFHARRVCSTAQYKSCEIWYLINPAVSTADIVATITGAEDLDGVLAGTNTTGVHQTTPFGTAVGADGDPGTAISVTVSPSAGDMAIDAVLDNDGGTLTVNGTQTQNFNVNSGITAGGSHKDGGTAMAWTKSASGLWVSLGTILKPSGGAAPTNVVQNLIAA